MKAEGEKEGDTGRPRPGQIMERRITGVVGGRPAMDKALTIRVRRGPGHTILTAAGEIDIATVARFRARLFALAGEGRPVIADLDQVSFIDASGLGALVGAARRAAAHGTSLHVVCARSQTRQLFHLTGLDRQLHLARTLTEALQALTAPGHARLRATAARPSRGNPGLTILPSAAQSALSRARRNADGHAAEDLAVSPASSGWHPDETIPAPWRSSDRPASRTCA